jgi:restriction system protein
VTMPIPDFQTCFLPVLQYLADGVERSNQEIYSAMEEEFNLSEIEKNELLPSGKQRVFTNRVAWAKSHLKQAGLLSSPRRGFYQITPQGEQIAKTRKERINIAFLNKYDSFVQFRSRKKEDRKNLDSGEAPPEGRTPEEDIESGMEALNERLKQDLIASLKNCSPRFFEGIVIDLLLAMGYGGSRQEAGRLTGKGSDGGIDGIINEDKLGLDVIYVQAKRWNNAIGRPEVQQFAGALQGNRAKKGIYITTSTFTREAQDFAQNIDSKVILIDGQKMADLMIEHDVGVASVQIFKIKKIDSDYFLEE